MLPEFLEDNTKKAEAYLSIEEVNTLLPNNLKIDIGNKLERSVYMTYQGKPLPVINSKYYSNQKYYWYSCITKHFKEIGAEFICFTTGNYGILVIPIDIVLHYNRFSGWKGESKKGRQYHVRIRHDVEHNDNTLRFINYNNHTENIDITKYLIKKE